MKKLYTLSFLALLSMAMVAHASSPTITIQSLTPGSTVSVGSNVSFAVATAGFIDPRYSLSDAFVGGSLGNINLNSAGEFSWIPSQNDVGVHNLTITVQDNSGNIQTITLTLDVTNTTSSTAVLSISSISPSTNITAGQTITFDTSASGFTGTPSYSVSDSFSGSSLLTSDINSYGDFSWTPTANDVGTHDITVAATDSSGNTARSTLVVQVSSAAVTTPTVVSTPVVTSTPVTTTPVVTTTPATPIFTENLTLGSTDSQVTALQQLLTAQGDYSGPITGYYGSLTQAAVMKFQAANAIEQLGIVGPSTRTALNNVEAATETSSTATTSTGTTPAVTTTTSSSPTIEEIKSEIQSLTTLLTQVEGQLTQITGQ